MKYRFNSRKMWGLMVIGAALCGSACGSDSGENNTPADGGADNDSATADTTGGGTTLPTSIFRVNTQTLGDQLRPRAVAIPKGPLAGGIAVVWQDGATSKNSAVKLQIYNKNGVGVGQEREIALGQWPDIAISPDGQRFAVAYATGETTTSAIAISQLVVSTGEQDGDVIVLAKGKGASRPRITTDGTGATWLAYEVADKSPGTTPEGAAYVDIEALTGPYPAALPAATIIDVIKKSGRQSLEGIAAVTGGAIVSFFEPGLAGNPGPYVAFVDSEGANKPNLLSDVLGAADFAWPTVAAIPGGTGAVALWYEWVGSGLSVQPALQVARLDALGNILGTPGTVAAFEPPAPVEGTNAHVALAKDGSALVAWSAVVQLSGTLDILVKPLSQTGEVIGSLEVLTKDKFASGKQLHPFVVALSEGGYLVLWDSESGADPDESPGTTGIYGKYLSY